MERNKPTSVRALYDPVLPWYKHRDEYLEKVSTVTFGCKYHSWSPRWHFRQRREAYGIQRSLRSCGRLLGSRAARWTLPGTVNYRTQKAMSRGYTISWAATCKAPTRHATKKSRCTRRCSGKMGSCATYRSTNRKQIPKTADEEKRIQTRGCVQGTFCPPISRAIKKLVMVTASVTVPGKSTRLSFRFSETTPWPGKSFLGPSSFQTTKRMATSANGHWMRNDLGRDQYTITIFPSN